MTVPDDFAAALAAHPKAQTFFGTLNKTNRYSFLWRITTAKSETTRQARIQKYIDVLEAEQAFR